MFFNNNNNEANVFIGIALPQVNNLKRRPYESKMLADIRILSLKKRYNYNIIDI